MVISLTAISLTIELISIFESGSDYYTLRFMWKNKNSLVY